jgi:hypothetical protein
MPTSLRLRGLFVPAIVGLILIVAVGWYNLFWLPSKHRYLDDRNFRVLRTMSEQIRLGINNFDKMMDNAADAGIDRDNLQEYLTNVAPQLEKPEDEETESIIGEDDYSDPPRVTVVADEGTHFLYIAFKRSAPTTKGRAERKQVKYAVRTNLERLIRDVLPPPNRRPFNIVLVAREDGTVIFQDSLPGIEVARVDMFEHESAATKEKKSEEKETVKSGVKKEELSESSRYSEVTLGGARYRLYSQPLQLSFQPIDAGKKGDKKEAAPAAAEKWILCGLVRTDAFQSESQSISYTYMLWLSVAILLALAAYPFVKLHLFSPLERVHGSDVVTIAVFLCVVAAVLTFILIDVYYWRYDFDQMAGAHMERLAEAIDNNFNSEKTKAFAQLDAFDAEDDLIDDLGRTPSPGSMLPRLAPNGRTCAPDWRWACRVDILKHNVEQYPYLQSASWSDSDGNQRIKWTAKKGVTPFLNLEKNESTTYYSDVKRALADVRKAFTDKHYPISAPTQGVATRYSPNTGDNITIFWKLFSLHDKKVAGADPKDVFCASLVTHPISVFDAVLPDGFQFAVIKSDGTVLFHSDRTKNLRENFLDETDQDQEVRSRVLMRASGPLVANYMGRRHRLYIRPMNSSGEQLWTVVVFRDLKVEDTMNLETLSLSSIMFLLYAAAIALALVLANYALRGRISGTCLWPDSRKTSTYRWLVIGNGIAALLLLLLLQLPAFFALLVCGFVIPMSTVGCNLLLLRRDNDPSSRDDEGGRHIATSQLWQLQYVGACTTLLVVVAVLPCLCFAKVAFDFEHKLMIARNQLSLASDIDERSKRVRRAYQNIELGEVGKTLVVAPGDLSAEWDELPSESELASEPERKEAPFFSYHHILGISINSQDYHAKDFALPTCDLSSSGGRQRCVELFLSGSSPTYDQVSADNRYLAETGSSTNRTWSSASLGRRQKLELNTLEADHTVRTVASLWAPLHIPWADWRWWLGAIALMAALFGLVRWSLRRIFLLDLAAPVSPENFDMICDPNSLIAKLSMNLLVIGSKSSSTIARLIKRREVQAWDMQDLLNVAQHSARTADGTFFVASSTGDPVDEIIRDGRPLVLYNCEATFRTPRTNHESLMALERVIANLGSKVVITTTMDPALQSPAEESEHWTTLLRSFVRIELNSLPAQRVDETDQQFESRLSAEAYQRWLFPQRPSSQKLVLVHLAQEGLVSPNSGGSVCDLMREGVVVCSWGLLTLKDSRFAEFLKYAVPSRRIKHWEGQVAGSRSDSIRTSLLVVGAGVAGFLIYTQGEVFNTWVTYATGLAAAIPAFIQVRRTFRGKGGAEA